MPEICTYGVVNPTKKICKICGYRCTEDGFRAFLARDTRKAAYKACSKNVRTVKRRIV